MGLERNFLPGGLSRGRGEAGWLEKHDPRERPILSTFPELSRIGGVASDQVVPLELIESPSPRAKKKRDGRFRLALRKPLAPKRRRRIIPDPDFASFRVILVAQAEGDDFIASVEDGEAVALALGWICVVGADDLREGVVIANFVIRHDASIAQRGAGVQFWKRDIDLFLGDPKAGQPRPAQV
jgi:hypothetical protein